MNVVLQEPPLLEVVDLKTHFPIREGLLGNTTGHVHAVNGVSFTLGKNETLGLVGESGSGKSTLGKSILRLVEPTSGDVRLQGESIVRLSKKQMFRHRRQAQMVFQDPYSSLNPRIPVGQIVAEAMSVHGLAPAAEIRERVEELFGRVGLRPAQTLCYANEFSGGQRQRIGIARALALNPSLIIADEPVSALDVSVQAQVINLMMDLQQEFGLSYLFIAHDLAVVAQISRRIAVMYLGRLMEMADRNELFRNAQHPYTEALLAAIPIANPSKTRAPGKVLQGDIPSPRKLPSGCVFHARCPIAVERCKVEVPEFREIGSGHSVACHLRG
ncbi:ABC transporter ATP-binding protein [Roseibium sp. SCP14]|uniref:ABC transporter ATP-binding protein n=1 Tax=Roseibium sp. SCP14 TaxID=3141375 RepID=UPI003337C766